MCGIAGIYHHSGNSFSKEVLKGMTDVIAHRGPDEDGFFLGESVALGIRRLKIIDLNTGSQPIHNEDKTVWTVFNGEIYNHRELRKELEAKGHRFYTKTDTEVIVHLYEEYGEEFMRKLNGMFAIALWDRRTNAFLLVRDRLGIKPLFYYPKGDRIVFGSEMKSILKEGSYQKQLCREALDLYLAYGYIPAPYTIFEGIKKLTPGSYLVSRHGDIQVKQYWDIVSWNGEGRNGKSHDEQYYEERIRDLLRLSVKRRLMSDVPLGAFLSGGIDSSSVVAFMTQLMDQPVKTFSIGFEESDYNELSDARSIAKYLGTDHAELIVKPSAIELLPKLVWAYDEPFADSSAIPTYHVSKLAREHVTVALSGDGGDEIFGGYTHYLEDTKDQVLSKLPGVIRKNVLGMIGKHMPINMRMKKFLEYIGKSKEQRYFQRTGIFSSEMRERLYSDDAQEMVVNFNSYGVSEAQLEKSADAPFMEQLLYLDLKTYLPYDILTKVDIASMVNSLEVRVPFLDHELVEFGMSIPSDFKVRSNMTKYILKRAVKDLLPPECITKKKQGFGVPLQHWLRNELKDFSFDILTCKTFNDRGLFNQGFVENLLQQHNMMRGDYSSMIWSLISLEMWCQNILDDEPVTSCPSDLSPTMTSQSFSPSAVSDIPVPGHKTHRIVRPAFGGVMDDTTGA